MSTNTIEASGHNIKVSKLDKELYRGEGITKADMLDHYRSVAEVMLPHLRGRPLVLHRFPDGIDDNGFFQKDASDYFPDWIHTIEVPTKTTRDAVRHVVCDDEATLLYLANQATIEFHPWLSTVDHLDRPDRMVIDLDPADGTELREIRRLAARIRDMFDELGLVPYVQATGGRGFHVTAPLDGAEDFDAVRALANEIADRLAAEDPDRRSTQQRRDARGERIFLDTNRNAYGQTAIAPYSLRARLHAPVATPLDWAELSRATPNGYTVRNIRRRLARKADPWADISEHAASAAEARRRLDRS
jgi:bifunctional non-homologous end joining protein LigD